MKILKYETLNIEDRKNAEKLKTRKSYYNITTHPQPRIKGRAIFRVAGHEIFFADRPVFSLKICCPSSFSPTFYPKKLSPVLKHEQIVARPVHLQNWSTVLFFARPFIRV